MKSTRVALCVALICVLGRVYAADPAPTTIIYTVSKVSVDTMNPMLTALKEPIELMLIGKTAKLTSPCNMCFYKFDVKITSNTCTNRVLTGTHYNELCALVKRTMENMESVQQFALNRNPEFTIKNRAQAGEWFTIKAMPMK